MIDMYSFGIVLWELFCFKKPYQDHDTIELPYLIGKKGIRPPRPLHLPPSLVNLMERCWAEVSASEINAIWKTRKLMEESAPNTKSCIQNPAERPQFDIILKELQRCEAEVPNMEAAVGNPRF